MWIDEYREKNGLELDDFARRVNWVGRKMNPPLWGTVSDTLIHFLERSSSPRTHPRIADAIATACHATPEQRDTIVDKEHRGTWKMQQLFTTTMTPVEKNVNTHKPGYERPIVKIDVQGRVVARYTSLTAAENCEDLGRDSIRVRCKREVKSEFNGRKYTFRFAEEWDKMTNEQKLEDLCGEVLKGEIHHEADIRTARQGQRIC